MNKFILLDCLLQTKKEKREGGGVKTEQFKRIPFAKNVYYSAGAF